MKRKDNDGRITKLMRVREVAAYLQVSQSTIYRLLRDGDFPALKIGSDWRFNPESIDRWRLEQEQKMSESA